MIIDTHCHLDDERFEPDLQSVIKRAFDNGIKAVIIPGADIKDLKIAREISHKFSNVFYAAGVHPDCIDGLDTQILAEFLQDEKCVGVGECGLDYFRLSGDESEISLIKQRQKDAFIAQIELAIDTKKPLIIHARECNDDIYKILLQYADRLNGAVLHCFNASAMLLNLAKFGFYFGIGGVLTFKNAKNLGAILPQIPMDKLLIETDAPYLTPEPFRGQRNEPSYTTFVADKMAEILNLSRKEIEYITTQNAKRLFGLEALFEEKM